MKESSKNNIKSALSSKNKINTRNLFEAYKKDFSTPKIKFFSISSKEDIIKKAYTNCFINDDSKTLKNTKKERGYRHLSNNFSRTTKYLSHNISKFKNSCNNTTEQNNKIVKDKRHKNPDSLFKKNRFKRTIIIDREGNNNLNINFNKRFLGQSTSSKFCYYHIKAKKINDFNIKPMNKFKKNKKNVNFKNNIVQNLLKIYKTEKLDTISSTYTETNSLFINSKMINNKKIINLDNSSNIIEDKDISDIKIENSSEINDSKRINEYTKVIDIMNDIKNTQINNNDISDYTLFIKNIPENKNKNTIKDNKENYNSNNNEFKSFLESSLQDEIYQIFKKSNKNSDDDSFNLSRSISEFDIPAKDKKLYDFEKIMHSAKKNEIKINQYNFNHFSKNFQETNSKINKKNNKEKKRFSGQDIYNEEKNDFIFRNNLCILI